MDKKQMDVMDKVQLSAYGKSQEREIKDYNLSEGPVRIWTNFAIVFMCVVLLMAVTWIFSNLMKV